MTRLPAVIAPLPSRHEPAPARAGESRLLRWWRTRTDYPDPTRPFRPTNHLDLLSGLRMMLWCLRIVVVALPLLIVAAVLGHAVPVMAVQFVGAAVGFGLMVAAPASRYALAGLILSSVRGKWADRWDEAGVPLTRLWMMIASPVTADRYATYGAAIGDEPTSRIDGGVDPRLVWWLDGNNMDPDTVAAYRACGLTPVDAVLVRDAGLTPEEWGVLEQSGLTSNVSTTDVLAFLSWVREGRASLHPGEFDRADVLPPRSVAEVAPVMAAWVRRPRRMFTNMVGGPVVLLRDNRLRLASEAGAPVEPFADQRVAGYRVGKWVDMAGLLAPFFIHAEIGFDEAERMVASGSLGVQDLEFLAAWNNPTT